MAFALAIKSKFDFPGVGDMFLLITLIITLFTLVYSSFLLEGTLKSCGIIITKTEEEIEEEEKKVTTIPNSFQEMKDNLYSIHLEYLLPFVQERKEPISLMKRLNTDFSNDHN